MKFEVPVIAVVKAMVTKYSTSSSCGSDDCGGRRSINSSSICVTVVDFSVGSSMVVMVVALATVSGMYSIGCSGISCCIRKVRAKVQGVHKVSPHSPDRQLVPSQEAGLSGIMYSGQY
ncbi:Hypothetical predicted protein [Octopus vulgaris]|uniref:Uncharacterized protein n=1 Tax=Octopus vulgaris TaxID=6645 RepID=A0AA36F6M8_OCTVU|nr:Hypothetical predicted protein [Octopus vulgaris]